ncbi:Eco57I restriction-modification methylase domain-containing protein [Cryptosporangium japonicum]|uniref:site-specific DNA-methyltransferase (adenine-specific) n=1 Tax=Cryptosporangium japonicum TaxID=80872 RepID=A0ABP3EVR8_9ACTN
MTATLTSVKVAGGLLPGDVLSSVLAGDMPGLSGADYHLAGEGPREAASRTWSNLLGVYRRFQDDLADVSKDDPAIGFTRDRWLSHLLAELGYGRVPTTSAGGISVGDRQYPVSHLWGSTPMHLLGWNTPLDKRTPGVAGAAQRAPHAMLQEMLNRADGYLWAILSNGHLLRLLRDSTTMTGQSYVEFDLESMFENELFSEFAMMYLLAHESRVEAPEDGHPGECWLEKWRTTAVSQGVRALTLLRDGVQEALETLGTGFLQNPANTGLREGLDSGELRMEDFHQALLRTVYRLLFWAVAEDREALLDPDADPDAASCYRKHFSSARLRHLALCRHGSSHYDLWEGVAVVMSALGHVYGEPRLGLPGLGGLFAISEADVLHGAKLSNQALLSAVRSLSVVQPKGQPRRTVDFRNLGAEELGSVYESLLELIPRRDPQAEAFSLDTAAGNDRKKSGSYYTPTELVELVLDTALDPVLDDAEKQDDPEAALLALTVCDPAIGSGHFVVAAARRIASRVAAIRTGEVDPTPTMLQDAMHDVVARCIYGVDVNPMAADLAKVSLWLEAMRSGRPLSFLDHHIKVGNALLGTTPALLRDGIPDDAYVALTGDDKPTVRAWKTANARERAGQGSLISYSNEALRATTLEIAGEAASARNLADIAWAARRYAESQEGPELTQARHIADAWCAAFLSPKTHDDVPITQELLESLREGSALETAVRAVNDVAQRHRLFHWHLEFPEIFPVGRSQAGGFSAMLGNPPWERIKLQEQEFFAAREPAIAGAKNAAARKKAIAELKTENPALLAEFNNAKRAAEAESHFLRMSGRYPLCGVGDVNTYSIFAEHFRSSVAHAGRAGIITPTGLATDATTAKFFADTLRTERLAAFFDFENGDIFEGVHNSFRFAATTITGGEIAQNVRLAFFLKDFVDVDARAFALTPDEILLLNPNTGTLPVFRTRRDADITLACYRRHPVLIRDGDPDGNPWDLRFMRMFDMANDSGDFRTAAELEELGAEFDGWLWERGSKRWLPLYESKMVSAWNHRLSTYEGVAEDSNANVLPRLTPQQLNNPNVEPCARYWVAESSVIGRLAEKWDRPWLIGWRNIARASDARTFIASSIPMAATGNSFLLALFGRPEEAFLIYTVWSSLVFDYIARQKLSGTNMVYFIVKQLPCPRPADFLETPKWLNESLLNFIRPRALELSYTSRRIYGFASDISPQDLGMPFEWALERRAQILAELNAAIFHIYGIDRRSAEHILDSFVTLKGNEEREFGAFRTKELTLTEYDRITDSVESNTSYYSRLNPSPGTSPNSIY